MICTSRTLLDLFVATRGSIAVILLVSCGSQALGNSPNTLSNWEKNAGWRLLFDGTTTEGWRSYRAADVRAGWSVEDGALVCHGEGSGDLITTEKFEEFELSLEYKISPGGNSGVIYHATEDADASWMTGPEIQIIDNRIAQQGQQSGWLYDLYRGNRDATRPAGEWNELRILVTKHRCRISLNGITYARYVQGDDEWKHRVAQSKFAQFAGFGVAQQGHICLQDHGDEVAFRNIKIRNARGGTEQFNPVDGRLPVAVVPAFPDLKWQDWSPFTTDGQPQPMRPVALVHAGDGSNRLFAADQRGRIYVWGNHAGATEAKIFLDIRDQTSYFDAEFERGLVGLAFHPRYRENGEFFVSYSTPPANFQLIVARFRVSGDDPDRADLESEEVLLELTEPYWNHNGGCLSFGPDGYLYIAFGDGGSAHDPHDNGQNRATLLGSVLRIDVDRRQEPLPYAIPADNPFVNSADARGEIWAFGFRNVWGLTFDRLTQQLWAADVGQDLYEEINLVERGGNYGWNRREATHIFGAQGSDESPSYREPIWEYDHAAGKSITGGYVYRGSAVKSLKGLYLYADFVSGRMWALRYDPGKPRATANYEIAMKPMAVTAFGEDESGEVLVAAVDAAGQCIYRFQSTETE